MLTPYCIARSRSIPGPFEDAAGTPMRRIEDAGLTLLVGEPIDPASNAASFMEAVARVHDVCACVPMRLGPPLPDDESARRLLNAGSRRFDRLLHQFTGCDEWSIVVEASDESSAPCVERNASNEGGRSYLEQERRRFDTASGLCPAAATLIAAVSCEVGPAVRDSRIIGRTDGGGTLVLLVERAVDVVSVFRRVLGGADLPCTLTGRWPPFSFVGAG
ncbi:MAG: GvpL/GvpF family gas vesicle protein [Planctomycetota bacterium]